MQMLANYILVDPERWTEAKQGSIIVPAGEQREKFARGTVMEVGSGLFLPNGDRPPIEVKVGDRVLYFKDGAAEVILDERTMHIVQERQILAILSANEFVLATDEGDSDAAS